LQRDSAPKKRLSRRSRSRSGTRTTWRWGARATARKKSESAPSVTEPREDARERSKKSDEVAKELGLDDESVERLLDPRDGVSVELGLVLALLTALIQTLLITALAMILVRWTFTNPLTRTAKSKRGRSAIAFRKRLASARQYFSDELQRSNPAIDDRWFPWVIAFGLDTKATEWVNKFGGRSTSSSDFSSSSLTSSSSES